VRTFWTAHKVPHQAWYFLCLGWNTLWAYIYIYIYIDIYIRERYIPIFIFSENDCRCVEIIRRCQHIYIYMHILGRPEKYHTKRGTVCVGMERLWVSIFVKQIADSRRLRGEGIPSRLCCPWAC
jgi:hypothetical protein